MTWWFAYGVNTRLGDARGVDIMGVDAKGNHSECHIDDAGVSMWAPHGKDMPSGLAALGAHTDGWTRTSEGATCIMSSGDTLRWIARRFLGIWTEGPPPTHMSLLYRATSPLAGMEATQWLLDNSDILARILDRTPETCMLVHLSGTPLSTDTPEVFPEMNAESGQLVHATAFIERAWSLHHHLILPHRHATKSTLTAATYEGGYNAPVHPETLLENGVVVILDIESSYPSMVCEYNIDIDVHVPLIEDGQALWEWFKARPLGTPSPLPMHFAGAKKLRIMRPDPRFKVRINAVYGALGNPVFAYSMVRVAAAITAACRHVIRQIHIISETLVPDARIVMGDTDSVAVHMSRAEHAMPIMAWCAKTFRFVRLKQECVLDRMIVLAKKHYAGHVAGAPVPTVQDILDERHVVVRGIETRHRTLCPFARRTLACAILLALYPDMDAGLFPAQLDTEDKEAWRLDPTVSKAYTTRKDDQCAYKDGFMCRDADGSIATEWYVRRQLDGPLRRVAEQAPHLLLLIDALVGGGGSRSSTSTAAAPLAWTRLQSLEQRFVQAMSQPDTPPCHVHF